MLTRDGPQKLLARFRVRLYARHLSCLIKRYNTLELSLLGGVMLHIPMLAP